MKLKPGYHLIGNTCSWNTYHEKILETTITWEWYIPTNYYKGNCNT